MVRRLLGEIDNTVDNREHYVSAQVNEAKRLCKEGPERRKEDLSATNVRDEVATSQDNGGKVRRVNRIAFNNDYIFMRSIQGDNLASRFF